MWWLGADHNIIIMYIYLTPTSVGRTLNWLHHECSCTCQYFSISNHIVVVVTRRLLGDLAKSTNYNDMEVYVIMTTNRRILSMT